MSYDLQVFSQLSLAADALRDLIAEAGLAVEDGDAGDTLTVVRGAKGRYSFTLDLPVAVEPEDVPEEVTATVLSPSFLYELMVEGSSTTETPHAVRFARRLAEASSGVVVDQQTGQTWARGKLRAAAPVQRGRIDVVELLWYTRPNDVRDLGTAWLELARRHLPEALPRRFGSFEPLRMKLDVEGPEAFVRAVAEETMSIFFKATHPCIQGSLAGGTRSDAVRCSLLVHREPLSDGGWRESLQRLFVEFALSTGAFFASAEVERGVGWSGGSVWYEAKDVVSRFPAGARGWSGLPFYPTWWAWFGPEYAPLVVNHVAAEQVKAFGSGLFHWRGEEPQDRDQLTAAGGGAPDAAKPRRGLFSRRGNHAAAAEPVSWLPRDLLATVEIGDPHRYQPRLIPAKTIPPSLA
jgi:hypothetical protein